MFKLRQFNLTSSGKDIPIPSRTTYMKKLITQTETFLKNARWKAFWWERAENSDDNTTPTHRREITTDFKSTKTPPQHELLKPFERDMYNLIGNIEFRKAHDPALQKMGEEARRINDSDMVIVNADKTGNKYEMSASDYKKLLHENITRDYKLDRNDKLNSINQDTLDHTCNLDIEDRMECHSEQNAFLTIKDHKEGFPNSIKCRVINPASNNLGKVSKRILDKINKSCRDATETNQWKSTQDVLQWFASVTRITKRRRKRNSYSSIFENFTLPYLKICSLNRWISPRPTRKSKKRK